MVRGFTHGMAPRLKRVLLAWLTGIAAAFVLGLLALRLPGGSLTLETVLLFIGFVAICLLLDRLVSLRQAKLAPLELEGKQARRLGQLRIGIPEGLVHLEAMRQQQRLEQRLEPLGVTVVWRDYLSASSLLQALNRGEIDFCGGGGTPSVFAQAADLMFVRVARDKYTHPGGAVILVPHDSHRHVLADLRGARVAVEEGSTAHYVLVRALMDVGLTLSDIHILFLSRSEALAQFQAGAVDAWSVWMPYADSPRRRAFPGRSIVSLHDLFGSDPSLLLPTLYYCTPELVRQFPAVLKLVLEEINEAGAQVNRDNFAAVQRLRDRLPLVSDWLDDLRSRALERSIVPLDEQSLVGLQYQADILRSLRLIPKRVHIADGTYSLIMRQNWMA